MKAWGPVALGFVLVVLTTIIVSRGVQDANDDKESSSSTSGSEAANQSHQEWRDVRAQPLASARDADVVVLHSSEEIQSQEKQEDPDDIAQNSDSSVPPTDSAAPGAFELLNARTAIGRPFPVSPTVERQCLRASDPGVTCVATREFLAEFSREPRDIPWARDRERRLEAGINALGPDKYAIRSIECRSTRCAVEVAASDPYLGDIAGDPELEQNLLPRIATFGLEPGSNGVRIVVTVFTFERR